ARLHPQPVEHLDLRLQPLRRVDHVAARIPMRCRMIASLRRVLAAALLAFASSVAWAQAGHVQLAVGDVQIIAPDKTTRAAVRGDVVNEGDTIVTGVNSA